MRPEKPKQGLQTTLTSILRLNYCCFDTELLLCKRSAPGKLSDRKRKGLPFPEAFYKKCLQPWGLNPEPDMAEQALHRELRS